MHHILLDLHEDGISQGHLQQLSHIFVNVPELTNSYIAKSILLCTGFSPSLASGKARPTITPLRTPDKNVAFLLERDRSEFFLIHQSAKLNYVLIN